MDRKKITIGITGNFLTDQRMQRIAHALFESQYQPLVYYRSYFKYAKGQAPQMPQFPFRIEGLKPWFNKGMAFYAYFNLYLFFKLLFKKTDAYYAVDSDTLLAFTLLSFIRQKPLVYDAHEYFAEVPELSDSPFKKKIWHAITQWGVRRAALCITVAPELAKALEKRYHQTFISLRNVPDLNQAYQCLAPENRTIVYQGALNKGRELELLIETMKELPDFQCVIIGEGDLSASLRAMAKDCKNIEFKGLMQPEELKKITPHMYVGYNLLDASESLSYYYSLSNKYFDYILAGIPSISSQLPEYMNLNAQWQCGVCIPNNKEALINLLISWKNNPSEYDKLKENTKFAAEVNHWVREKEILIQHLPF